MQEQTKTHTSRRSRGDDDEKFETSPHRTLMGIAGFDRSQHHSRESRRPCFHHPATYPTCKYDSSVS
jgi:hypothetical protein